ncbi:unnamed protein product [Thelazia callipaeda]|uniref:CRIB domain-containing protein n=1 Tax=Thelazia callipaeda TaxID=103827 RepID=A0A0N5CXT4_THECL|nr:unnamed protein product [Thelazia callipaeda]
MDDSYIVLDVGGRLFKTKIQTLLSADDSYFRKLLSTSSKHSLNSDGHLFIDRDGEIFSVVLGYLRHGKSYPLPNDDYKLSQIVFEAQFYQLSELAETAENYRSYLLQSSVPSKFPVILQKERNSSSKHTPSKNRAELSSPVLSIPTIAPPLPIKSAGSNTTLLRRLSKTLQKKVSKDEIHIGPPKHFKHVVHIGWGDDGQKIIIDHSNHDEKTLKAVVQAIYEQTSTLPLVYSMVDTNIDKDSSESVEIFFTKSTIQAFRNPSSASEVALGLQTGVYDNCCYEIARSETINKNYAKSMKISPIVTDM